MARCVFAEEHARFRRKRGSKKWQGGHLLRAFRGSAFRLHCFATRSAPLQSRVGFVGGSELIYKKT